ncbi:MAG: CocE/NonD family hydrolase [Chloroflexi bacterium]|nr:CocE/NonD family hydrolase [Chloroflexota bacterium]
MRDGTILKADIYRPDDGGRHPVLLLRTPYRKLNPRYVNTARKLAEHGYTVVCQDTRGRYDSQGEFLWQFMDNSLTGDAEDGYDTVEWAAQLAGSDGQVGTWGHSYDAWTSWRMAELQPPSLKAIHASGMGTRSLDMNFGIFETGRRLEWTYMMAADMRKRAGIKHGPHSPVEAVDQWRAIERGKWIWYLPLGEIPGEPFSTLTPQLKQYYGQQNVEMWDFDSVHPKVNVPAAMFTGWWDRVIGTVKQFTGLETNGPESLRGQHRLVIGPWSHMMTTLNRDLGPIDYGPQAQESWENLILRWYNYQFKGIDDGIGTEPGVKLFVLGANEWVFENEWPLKHAEYVPFYLSSRGGANTPSGDGVLSHDLPASESPDRYSYDPRDPVMSVMDIDAQAMPRDQKLLDGRQDILVYKTKEFEKQTRFIGPVELELWTATDALDTDWTAKLVLITREGLAVNLTYGIMRARYREGFDREVLLDPGVPQRYSIKLNPIGIEIQPGQRLRLDISSSDFPNFDRNHNTGKDFWTDKELRVANQTVFHSSEMPSRLMLPLVTGA